MSILRFSALVVVVSLLVALIIVASMPVKTATADPDCPFAISQSTAAGLALKIADEFGFDTTSVSSSDLLTFAEIKAAYDIELDDIYDDGNGCAWVEVVAGTHITGIDTIQVYLDSLTGAYLASTRWNSLTPTPTQPASATPTSGPSPTLTASVTPLPTATP